MKALPKVSGLVGASADGALQGNPGVHLGAFDAPSKVLAKSSMLFAPAPSEGSSPMDGRNVPKLARISLDLIDESLEQNRLEYDEDSLQSLGETLKIHQVDPIVLRSKANGRYELRSGHRRRRAAMMVGMSDLMALVYGVDADVDNDRIGLDILVANEQRESLGDFERALGYRRKMEQTKITQIELARRLGLDRALVSKRLAFFRLPQSAQDALMKYPRVFSHKFIPDILDALSRTPDLESTLVQGIVAIGAGETGPEALVRSLTRLSHQQATSSTKSLVSQAERSVSVQGGRHVCTVRMPTGNEKGVLIRPAKGVDPDAFAVAVAALIETHKDAFNSFLGAGAPG